MGEPTQPAKTGFVSGRRFSGWRPFSLDSALHLVVAASVNGIATTAIIDSGAGRTIVDREFAKRLKLASGRGFRAAGVTSNTDGDLASGVSLRLGDFILGDLDVAVLDLSILSKVAGKSIDVIVGRELFDRVVVDLNFAKQRLGFFDFGAPPNPSNSMAVALIADSLGRRYVSLSIDGRDEVPGCYDLGNDVSLVISPEYANAHNLFDGLRVSSVASAGVSGISLGKVAVLPKVRVGEVTFSNVPAQVPSAWNQSASVLAGLPIWSRFENVVDSSRDRLSLTLIPNASSKPFPKDRSGIGAARANGHLQIIHVAEGSPAEGVGLRPGDEIVAIDGKLVDSAYLTSHARLGFRPAGTAVGLKLGDGRQLHMVLADYF